MVFPDFVAVTENLPSADISMMRYLSHWNRVSGVFIHMPVTDQLCGKEIVDHANVLVSKHHEYLLKHKVKIDYVFAFGPKDEDTGETTGPALELNGYRALGIARIMRLKQRVLGRGDAEISLDGSEWPDISKDGKTRCWITNSRIS